MQLLLLHVLQLEHRPVLGAAHDDVVGAEAGVGLSLRRNVVGPQWEREGERLQSLLLEREELAAAYYGLPTSHLGAGKGAFVTPSLFCVWR